MNLSRSRDIDFKHEECTMTLTKVLDTVDKFEIQPYIKKPGHMEKEGHIPFSGSPKKHPYDPDRIILIVDPFAANTFYYEFKIKDIGCAEELANITNIDGESVPMARIWVKKQSIGVQSIPFVVDTIRTL